MNTEEKAKAYDEALERARQIKNGEGEWRYSDLIEITPALTEIFPQLQESEDERIRKWLIDYFSSIKETVWIHRDITCEQILEWLKKQEGNQYFVGYAKGYSEGQLNSKQKEQKQTELPAGFYVTLPDGKKYYAKEMRCNGMNIKVVEPKPTWSEEDELMRTAVIQTLERFGGRGTTGMQIDWLKLLPERFNLQPKNEWSEEDGITIADLINYFEGDSLGCSTEEMIQRIKSLRPPFWKPSELEKGALRTAIHILTDERNFPKAAAQLQNILDAFEGKESRKDWKPSEEQIQGLAHAINLDVYDAQRYKLDTLYDDLRKLM